MTKDQIKAIAEEYRKEYDYHKDVANDAIELLTWLSTRYCIVEREKVMEAEKYPHRHCANITHTLPVQVIGIRKVLHDLFGTSMFVKVSASV